MCSVSSRFYDVYTGTMLVLNSGGTDNMYSKHLTV